MVIRQLFRNIRASFARFFAIMAIIALGVGFFAGLTVTKDAMIVTGDDYLREHAMYDFRLISTLGITDDDAARLAGASGYTVRGAYSADIVSDAGSSGDAVMRIHSITDGVNTLSLKFGRMPESADECVVDARMFGEDEIGRVISAVSDDGSASLAVRSYKVVGIANSVMYLNHERGTSTLGGGKVAGFMFVLPEAFDSEVYTEAYLCADLPGKIYTDEYDDAAAAAEDEITPIFEDLARERYDTLVSDATDEVDSAEAEYESSLAEYEKEKSDAMTALDNTLAQIEAGESEVDAAAAMYGEDNPMIAGKRAELRSARDAYESARADAEAEFADAAERLASAKDDIDDARLKIADIKEPDTYVLGRNANTGYVCFDTDSSIVEGVARVFPLFFFLVAALVCSTTMTRMIDEQRGKIGTLKALGYSDAAVMSIYGAYSGSAALIGAVAGFFVGTWLFPYTIWTAYGILYGFAEIHYLFSPILFAISLAAALACSLGVTLAVGARELHEFPAALMRPKAPADGKRILLERITPLWKRMKFLHKVSARNIFRYKKRLVMMIAGIGGCMALMLTGFGISDSVKNIVAYQYDDIMKYDFEVSFADGLSSEECGEFADSAADLLSGIGFLTEKSVDVTGDETKSATLICADGDISEFFDMHRRGESVPYPGSGEVAMNEKLASMVGVSVGDSVTLAVGDRDSVSVTVSGIFENYVGNYVCVGADVYESVFGEEPTVNAVFAVSVADGDLHSIAASLINDCGADGVSVSADLRERVDGMMASMNYIILLVIICAGALAFIVLFNLGNINITERVREIATIKVLGFYPGETGAYVLRENIVLTAMGTAFGIIPGIALHRFVMAQIKIDMVSFAVKILPQSYLYAVALTFVFSIAVDLIMRRKLSRISMTESLKSVE